MISVRRSASARATRLTPLGCSIRLPLRAFSAVQAPREAPGPVASGPTGSGNGGPRTSPFRVLALLYERPASRKAGAEIMAAVARLNRIELFGPSSGQPEGTHVRAQ